ncbi:MAG: DNA polymerase III subunit gamma/tau [Selenomonadaceae bacterium]|nr:DNA polymerase III subunit gamma/tau [Selenomonadaceae bacterium]
MAHEALYTRTRPRNLAQLVGQEHISTPLTRAVNQDRLSHAYLLVGTRGTGKTSTARLLARAVNCDTVFNARQENRALAAKEIPCGKCDACRNFDRSPDNVEFDAASNRSVEDISRLLSTVYLAPMQSRVKTFIIDEVHMLSFEAVNSILKLIEEPPDNVIFFLATTEYNKVPLTIRSRCQILNFKLIGRDKIADYIVKVGKHLTIEIERDAAMKIARLARGSMRDALTLVDQCYSMLDGDVLTLDRVDETLGLVADSDLDDLISAVRSKERAKISLLTSKVFASGITAANFAEDIITRARDLITALNDNQSADFYFYERMIDLLRKAVVEMHSSGIADIILETTLLKLTVDPAPVMISGGSQSAQSDQQSTAQTSAPADKFDAVRSELVDDKNPEAHATGTQLLKALIKYFTLTKKANTVSSLKEVERADFDNNTLTLTFQTGFKQQAFDMNYRAEVEYATNALLEKMIKLECKSIEGAVEKKSDFATAVAKSKPKTRRRLVQAHDLFEDLTSNF